VPGAVWISLPKARGGAIDTTLGASSIAASAVRVLTLAPTASTVIRAHGFAPK